MLTASNDRPTCLLHQGWRIEVVFEPAANSGIKRVKLFISLRLCWLIGTRGYALEKYYGCHGAFKCSESERVGCVVITTPAIAMMVGSFVWFVVSNGLGQPTGVAALLPVWMAGMAGGAVCTLYSARQGVAVAAVSGLLLALGPMVSPRVFGFASDR